MPEPTVYIKLIGWDELIRRFGDFPEHLDRGVYRGLKRISDEVVVPELMQETPIGAHRKLQNCESRIYGYQVTRHLSVYQPALSIRGFPYGAAVRVGTTGPRKAPSYKNPDIRDWVRAKWGVTGHAVDWAATKLVRHIRQHGTRANPYHERVVARTLPAMRNIMIEEVQRACATI
jgi:hypothetical protein